MEKKLIKKNDDRSVKLWQGNVGGESEKETEACLVNRIPNSANSRSRARVCIAWVMSACPLNCPNFDKSDN